MNELQRKAAERELLVKEIDALFAKGNDKMTDADLTEIETKNASLDTLDTEIVRLKAIEGIQQKNAQRSADLAGTDTGSRPSVDNDSGSSSSLVAKTIELPARFKGAVPKNFLRISDNKAEAQKKAFMMGQYLLATLGGSQKSADWCNKNGLTVIKAQSENVNENGGFLVPPELDSDLIQLKELFGVVRQLFKRVPMKGDTKMIPRRTGGVTAYHAADGDGIAASQKQWDMVTLTAQKIAALVLYSNELSEDAIIDIADDLSQEIAWAFSLTEDQDGFNGDGTSKYGGALGIIPALIKMWGVGGGAGLIQASGAGYANSWGSITLSDLNRVKGALPRYAAVMEPVWVMSAEFYSTVIEKLLVAAGGNAVSSIQMGGDDLTFLGRKIVFAQVMPMTPAKQQVPLLYGAFNLAAMFGDRRSTTIAMSDQFAFANDQLAIRGTERYAINVHDIGQADNRANPSQPGPQSGSVVGLITPNS